MRGLMADRKIRTREHVIAAMSLHHVGYIVAKAGYVFDAPNPDYGLDGLITTFDETGAIEGDFISVQLKATDHIRFLSDGRISFPLDLRDVAFWLDDFSPVILIVFDARAEMGYYLAVQEHFRAHPLTAAQMRQATLTVRMDPRAIVSESAVRLWRDLKTGDRKARA